MARRKREPEMPEAGRQQSLPLSWDGQAPPTAEPTASATPPRPPRAEIQSEPSPEPEPVPKTEDISPETLDAPETTNDRPAAVETPVTETAEDGRETESPRIVKLSDVQVSLGQTLMEARGACNLTVTQVSQKTRVPREFIVALESDDLEQLPAAVYTRSYIRQLARECGLDAVHLVERYDTIAAEIAAESGDRARFVLARDSDDAAGRVEYRLRSPRDEGDAPHFWRPARILIGGLLAVFTVLVMASLVQWALRSRDNTAATPESSAYTDAPEVDLDELIAPQQLPLVELDVPTPPTTATARPKPPPQD